MVRWRKFVQRWLDKLESNDYRARRCPRNYFLNNWTFQGWKESHREVNVDKGKLSLLIKHDDTLVSVGNTVIYLWSIFLFVFLIPDLTSSWLLILLRTRKRNTQAMWFSKILFLSSSSSLLFYADTRFRTRGLTTRGFLYNDYRNSVAKFHANNSFSNNTSFGSLRAHFRNRSAIASWQTLVSPAAILYTHGVQDGCLGWATFGKRRCRLCDAAVYY